MRSLILLVALFAPGLQSAWAQGLESKSTTWSFAVSGASRNCGDVVMPAISKAVIGHNASFFWHLGTYRNIYRIDEDFQQAAGAPVKNIDYYAQAWDDFIKNQLIPFGSVPVFLTKGNHEAIPPKSSEDFIRQFGDWLATPQLTEQRLKDDPTDHVLKTYYHWIQRGIDFVSLDNSTDDQFDGDQLTWFEMVLKKAGTARNVKTVVVGMHVPLPESIAAAHGMDVTVQGLESGLRVYADLLRFRNSTSKGIYVLASDNNYYVSGIFQTEYWRTHGGVLPGWIIGTGGAERYQLPADVFMATEAETNVYGYLLGTVSSNGRIRFDFHKVSETDVPPKVIQRYSAQFVHWCFSENTSPH